MLKKLKELLGLKPSKVDIALASLVNLRLSLVEAVDLKEVLYDPSDRALIRQIAWHLVTIENNLRNS